uniref:Methyltransferase domain-containing protein n=1 Tax=candidate division WWE3 bacterium TaxID=2053526 RepID=A0A7C4TNP2_UNCKA
MKELLIKFLFQIRAVIVRNLLPKSGYFLFSANPKRSLEPISKKFGFDRGTPVDRYYIEKFLEANKGLIEGKCLEIHDNHYTKKYGAEKVTHSDALDVDTDNKAANIIGDLRNLTNVQSNSYDCLIITHTFGVIDEYERAIAECHRILKPGGVLLATVSAMGIAWDVKNSFWRFTVASASYVFSKYFKKDLLEVDSYGNVLSGQAFWVGLGAEELSIEELNHNDKHFPVIVTIKAEKEI